jgi:hypothetical protein
MDTNERKTPSPKTADEYEDLIIRLDKVASMNEYTGSRVTPDPEYESTEHVLMKEIARNESRKRQSK